MEIVSITTLCGVVVLCLEKFYDYLNHRKTHKCKSDCCGGHIETETTMKD